MIQPPPLTNTVRATHAIIQLEKMYASLNDERELVKDEIGELQARSAKMNNELSKLQGALDHVKQALKIISPDTLDPDATSEYHAPKKKNLGDLLKAAPDPTVSQHCHCGLLILAVGDSIVRDVMTDLNHSRGWCDAPF